MSQSRSSVEDGWATLLLTLVSCRGDITDPLSSLSGSSDKHLNEEKHYTETDVR